MVEGGRSSLIDDVFRLFVGRRDAYAIQRDDGSYIRINGELTPYLIEKYLRGEITVGVYQVERARYIS
jgi:hypothetical protein